MVSARNRSPRAPQAFEQAYEGLLTIVRSATLLSGFCYTQLADTYQEANCLLYADRTPKFPIEAIAAATRGRIAGHPQPDAMEQWNHEGPRQEGVLDGGEEARERCTSEA